MLCGKMERLEQVLDRFSQDNSVQNIEQVKVVLAQCAALGDTWQVPIDPMPEDMNETDYEDGRALGGMPTCLKKTVITRSNEIIFCAFTDPQRVSLDSSEEPVLSVAYPVGNFLREFVESDYGTGLIVNPWTSGFRLTRKEVKEILERANSIYGDKARSLQFYRIQPRAVIDTGKIIAEWDEGWEDDGEQEPWQLRCWPIMPDGHFLLVFEQENNIHNDEGKTVGTHCRYRVLEYDVEGGEPVLLQKYRFSIDNGRVGTVFLRDGELFVASRMRGSNSFGVRQILAFEENEALDIYSNIRTATTDSRGNLAVAYVDNLSDDARLPMILFSPEGKAIRTWHEEYAHACEDLMFDAQDHLWFHIYPSADLKEMDIDTGEVTTHKLEMQGFCAFALSSDCSKLFLKFNETGGGCLFYVLHRDEDGGYKNPIRFEFPPNENGTDEKEIDYKAISGMAASKNLVLLRMRSKMYLYGLDDLKK